ncbi:bpX6 domain-containing protein [Myxococcus sp. RHSTA-1-4]|uniref:bpX6 domain-containing protein n=1 Tax=Myxococcus sp. RHSTA-1-4 TaxID=2874601 RepID=UPI001CBDB9E2|nr:bpX6 domain-containing protein [Myxococcus sp. RHSTA-1-4]MBZ4420435.1 hypothetical protein [Myxococcus sp. RHSTA-1-4]
MSGTASLLRPRRHLHRGTVRAAALWFDPMLLGEGEARRRVLAAWTPAASVHLVAGGYLLRLPQSRAVASDSAPGLPLTLEQGVLSSAPLSAGEREQLALREGSVVLVRAGVARAYPLAGAPAVDLSEWLDVSEWVPLPARGLGAPPPPVPTLEPLPPPTRAFFGPSVPTLAPEAQGVLARMQGRAPPEKAMAARRPGLLARLREALFGARGPGKPSASRPPSRLRRWLASFFARSGTPHEGATASARGGSGEAPPGTRAEPSGPSLLSRLSEWMLLNTPLGQMLGRRKAEYVRRLFEMFEEGNLQEALRYAIPLGSGLDENTRVALGLPGPREKLTIQTGQHGAASVFAGGQELFAALKERYREAFRRFEREGRIDEAAFILAELLGAHEEAVSFLERHGRFRLAAELAEGRNLPPGLVVRQWFLAKDVARATAIARRSGAFADAVLRLSRTHPEEARVLRLLWAETLAEAGDWAHAVQTLWPITDARALAREWVERGVECGGASGARLLALWATAFPDGLETAAERVRELLEDDTAERAPERFAFALTLSGESPSPGRTALVVPTVRALLRDRAAGHARFASDFVTRLLRDAPDGTLRADLPPLSERSTVTWSSDVSRPRINVTVRASDAGAFPVHDAVALPDGRLLLALGEAGARLVRADGRTVAHFDVPAFSLVPSVHGDRALALAPRGEVRRLSRLDLVARRAVPWCDARLEAWAPTYDGNTWFVSSGHTVMMVDAFSAGLRALWRVPDLPGRVLSLAVDAARLSFLVSGPSSLERWTYDLAQGPTLRARGELPLPVNTQPATLLTVSLTSDGEVTALVAVPVAVLPLDVASSRFLAEPAPTAEHEVQLLWLQPAGTRSPQFPESVRPGCEVFVLAEHWRVDVMRCSGHWQLHLVDARGTERALLVFEGTDVPRVRLFATALLAFDSRGRLLALDLERGTVRHVAVP